MAGREAYRRILSDSTTFFLPCNSFSTWLFFCTGKCYHSVPPSPGTCRHLCGVCRDTCRPSCTRWWVVFGPVSGRVCAASPVCRTAPPSAGTSGRRWTSTRPQVGAAGSGWYWGQVTGQWSVSGEVRTVSRDKVNEHNIPHLAGPRERTALPSPSHGSRPLLLDHAIIGTGMSDKHLQRRPDPGQGSSRLERWAAFTPQALRPGRVKPISGLVELLLPGQGGSIRIKTSQSEPDKVGNGSGQDTFLLVSAVSLWCCAPYHFFSGRRIMTPAVAAP